MVGLEETKVSTMVVNCCTLWRVFCSRPATHRLLRLALLLSRSEVNWRTAKASGAVLIAKSFAFCSTDNAFWKSLKAATSGSVLLILALFGQTLMALMMLRCLIHLRYDSTPRSGSKLQLLTLSIENLEIQWVEQMNIPRVQRMGRAWQQGYVVRLYIPQPDAWTRHAKIATMTQTDELSIIQSCSLSLPHKLARELQQHRLADDIESLNLEG